MKVLVAGASGAIGRPLSRQLIGAGHEVIGITRTPANTEALRAAGVRPIAVDVLDRAALLRAVDGLQADAVVHILTALKKIPTKPSDLVRTNTLRTEGTKNLLEAARAVGGRRFVFESFFKGYGFEDFRDRLLTEDDPFGRERRKAFEPLVAALRDGERLTFAAPGMTGIALRFGFLYGRDGGTEPMVSMLRRHAFPIPFGGGSVNSYLHVEDAAAAIVRALDERVPAGAYNVADDEPLDWAQVLGAVASAYGVPGPLRVPSALLRIMPMAHANLTLSTPLSNAKAKSVLGWSPRYLTVRDGLAADREASSGERRATDARPAA